MNSLSSIPPPPNYLHAWTSEVEDYLASHCNLEAEGVSKIRLHAALKKLLRIEMGNYHCFLWPEQWAAFITLLDEGRPIVGWFEKWRGDQK